MRRMVMAAGLLLLAGPGFAEGGDLYLFGGDAFGAGAAVTVSEPGLGDVFGAGARVEIAAPIEGSAHLAGRRVVTAGAIGRDLVAIGAAVSVSAPVAGSVTAAGYDVDIGGDVGDNLRSAGRNVTVTAPVTGSALIMAGALTLDARIGGDASLDAEHVVFGPGAAVGGRLTLYGPEAATLAVPEGVAPAERVERHPEVRGPRGEESALPVPAVMGRTGWMAVTAFAAGALVLAALAFLVALVAPRRTEDVAEQLADAPVRTVWIGFLTLSALFGACVVAMLTIVGVVAVPVILLVTAVACFIAYIIAVYVLGRAVWVRIDRLPPDTLGERALAALAGAVIVSLASFVPFVGWPLILLLALAGLGALSIALFRPEFGR